MHLYVLDRFVRDDEMIRRNRDFQTYVALVPVPLKTEPYQNTNLSLSYHDLLNLLRS